MSNPKISIVTPNYNLGAYLEQTIDSIMSQGYPNLEYIIVDGGSTDNSVEIIKKYEKHLAWWVSEPDQGMYDAVNKGFQRSTGEIMAYLNSDDMYHRKALFTMAQIFKDLPEVKWVQGAQTFYNEAGQTVRVLEPGQYSKYRYYSGDFSWIQQESTFWRRSLWEKAGGFIDSTYQYAGDLDLWMRFFQYEKLHTANVLIGGYRMREGQLGKDNIDEYFKEAQTSLGRCVLSKVERKRVFEMKVWRRMNRYMGIQAIPFLKKYRESKFEFPPLINFNKNVQRFEFGE